MIQLKKMNEGQLEKLEDFHFMNKYGCISYLEPVNLNNLIDKLGNLILIEQNTINIYPN